MSDGPKLVKYSVMFEFAPDYRAEYVNGMVNVRYDVQRDGSAVSIGYDHVDGLIAALQEIKRVVDGKANNDGMPYWPPGVR